jgi:nicotinate-nucleotide adenylyltransferase
MSKIAVFGSAFNPPSLGHKSVIESLSHFDQVLLLPSIAHAWGKQMLDYPIRCELVDIFISELAAANVIRSRVEEELHRPGESVTTFAVLERLQELNPEADITFVMGPDNLLSFGKFYQSDQILSRWTVMSCPEKIKVRSTHIRQALSDNKDINFLTTPKVARKLAEREYY